MSRPVIYKRIALCMLAGLVFGGVLSEVSYYFLKTGETRPPQVVEIDIPQGTAVRVSQGISDPSLPANMTFVVGDTLLVKNQDSVVHQLGPLFVPPGTSSTMTLGTAQEYAVSCSFQPSKYLGLSVQSPLTLGTRLIGVLEVGIPMGMLLCVYGLFAVPVKKVAAA
jgi:hypothetical protein